MYTQRTFQPAKKMNCPDYGRGPEGPLKNLDFYILSHGSLSRYF